LEILAHDSRKKKNECGNGQCDDQHEGDDPSQQKSAFGLWSGRSDSQDRVADPHEL